MIITIDGPAGAGKSTAAKLLAKKINFQFLDTGAMYRAVALAALNTGASSFNEPALEQILSKLTIRLEENKVILNGMDVSIQIRTKETTELAGVIATSKVVRTKLVELQRTAAFERNMVCEGRDQGTTVFPEAFCKFFLTARPEMRAQRRFIELQEKGVVTTLQEILDAIISRDLRDENREISPLMPAHDALILDTSDMHMNNVIEVMHQEIQRRGMQ